MSGCGGITAGVRTQVEHNRIIPKRPILFFVFPSPDAGNRKQSSYFCTDLNQINPVLSPPPPLNFRSVPLRLSWFIFILAGAVHRYGHISVTYVRQLYTSGVLSVTEAQSLLSKHTNKNKHIQICTMLLHLCQPQTLRWTLTVSVTRQTQPMRKNTLHQKVHVCAVPMGIRWGRRETQ